MFAIRWKPSVHTDLFKSSDMLNWSLEAENVVPSETNSVVKVNDRYYAYTTEMGRDTTDLYTATDPTDFRLERRNILPGDDAGVYYEDGLFHAYWEKGKVESPYDAEKIGHSVSPNGIDGWAEHSPVVDSSDSDYDVGDPFVTKIGEKYHMLTDWNLDKPLDNIRYYVGDNLYDFERGDIILNGSEEPRFGGVVGDGWLVHAEGKWWMFFESGGKQVWVWYTK